MHTLSDMSSSYLLTQKSNRFYSLISSVSLLNYLIGWGNLEMIKSKPGHIKVAYNVSSLLIYYYEYKSNKYFKSVP